MSIRTKNLCLKCEVTSQLPRITNTLYPPFNHRCVTKAIGGNLVSWLKVSLVALRNIYSSILFIEKLSKSGKMTFSLKRRDDNNNTNNSNNSKAK